LFCKNVLCGKRTRLLTVECFSKVLCRTEICYAKTKGFTVNNTEKLSSHLRKIIHEFPIASWHYFEKTGRIYDQDWAAQIKCTRIGINFGKNFISYTVYVSFACVRVLFVIILYFFQNNIYMMKLSVNMLYHIKTENLFSCYCIVIVRYCMLHL